MVYQKQDPIREFEDEKRTRIESYQADPELQRLRTEWIRAAFQHKYMYNFSFLGRPIIQTPIDIVAMQELIWTTKPDLIIETGIAHGGSLVFSASMLALLDLAEAAESGLMSINPTESRRKVLGIDIDIRAHNRAAIEAHPLASRISMIEGSSTDLGVVDQVEQIARDHRSILICLDSSHTHKHVSAELEVYAPLTSIGSYCVVFDTIVEELPASVFPDRPWDPQNNPRVAVREYLAKHPEFEIDEGMENKLWVTLAPGGFLRRIA